MPTLGSLGLCNVQPLALPPAICRALPFELDRGFAYLAASTA